MPLMELPDGTVVNVADGAGPDVVAQLRAQHAPKTRTARREASKPRVDPQDAEARRRYMNERMAAEFSPMGSGRELFRGLTFNNNHRIVGGIKAGIEAVRKGTLADLGKDYRSERDMQRRIDRLDDQERPVTSLAGQIGGGIVNPLGTGGKVLQGVGMGLNAVKTTKAAGHIVRAGTKLRNLGPVASAAMAGGNQGALNAAGMADDNILDSAGNGFIEGSILGGGLGGVAKVGGRLVHAIKDRGADQAGNVAYSRIADLLKWGGHTPQSAADELAATNKAGGDGMVMDLSPGLRAQAALLSRKPDLPSSNTLIERTDARYTERPGKFTEAVDRYATPTSGRDALARGDDIASRRKAKGDVDYAKGGAMDDPLVMTPELETHLRTAPRETNAALRNAYDDMLLRRESPGSFAKVEDGLDGKVTFEGIPNLRTFDYVKRGFDTEIGKAIKAGNNAQAQGLSRELGLLKEHLIKGNPDYADILKAQRDLYQQQSALDYGSGVLKKLGTQPRQVLRDIKKIAEKDAKEGTNDVLEARTGIIDALMNADNKADPVAMFRNMSRNKAQRKVLAFAFGGDRELAKFQKFIEREVRATRADVMSKSGGQSITSRISQADEDAGESGRDLLLNAWRGYAFGGPVGAASGVARFMRNLSGGVGRLAQEEIAQILMSKGKGLSEGVEKARTHLSRRARRQVEVGTGIGKAAGALIGPYGAE